jgi:hypothetical protein
MDGLTAFLIVVSLTLGVVPPKYLYDAYLCGRDLKRDAPRRLLMEAG